MKRTLFVGLTAAAMLAAGHARAQTPSFPLVQTIGAGINESFLVLDFEDGTANQSYGFGYLYNPTVGSPALTGADMIEGLAAAPIGLTVNYYKGYSPTDKSPLGIAISGFTYAGHSEGGFQNNGYWSLWTSTNGQTWTSPPVGVSSIPLTNGSYEGWAWDVNNAVTNGPVTPSIAAVPESSPAWFLLAGLPLVLMARRHAARR